MKIVSQQLQDTFNQLEGVTRRARTDAMRYQLPYALLLDDGWVLPLNRGYSPIGEPERQFIDYSTSKLWFPDVWLDYRPGDVQGTHIYLARAGVFGRLHQRSTRAAYLTHCRRVLWPLLEVREELAA